MKNQPKPIPSSEITPEHIFLNRRKFIQLAGLGTAAAILAACAPSAAPSPAPSSSPTSSSGNSPILQDERKDPANTLDQISHYNNYYEFSLAKEDVADLSQNFKAAPWTVEVGGLVGKPATFAIEDLMKKFPSEERIYRHRCVEGWSMVIPWMGFPLAKLLQQVEPSGDAKFVAFRTMQNTQEFPGQMDSSYPWPYTEGLRLDEAQNDLALLVTGLYGKSLPNQNGAPLRLAVPWKYGFKSIKAITKIDLVAEMPPTLWNTIASNEYGFYANVNPDVPHPRWSQSSERRIGELNRRKTLLFNGYADQVASLYSGMDLKTNY